MKVEITHKFKKQVETCDDLLIRKKVAFIIESIIEADSLKDIIHLKKLKGGGKYYSIRVSNYRIGLISDKNIVIFSAFDHRSAIYKYFP